MKRTLGNGNMNMARLVGTQALDRSAISYGPRLDRQYCDTSIISVLTSRKYHSKSFVSKHENRADVVGTASILIGTRHRLAANVIHSLTFCSTYGRKPGRVAIWKVLLPQRVSLSAGQGALPPDSGIDIRISDRLWPSRPSQTMDRRMFCFPPLPCKEGRSNHVSEYHLR